MRIIHAPTEIAGQMGLLCAGLRARGHEAYGYNWFLSYLKYSDNIINTDLYELTKMIPAIVNNSDILHFHNGNTFLLNNHDLPFLYRLKKRMVMHHWGNDVRTQATVRKTNPYPLPHSYLDDRDINKRLRFLSRYIDTAIVQDFELYRHVAGYYKKVHILPLACQVTAFESVYPPLDRTRPIIVHAPTNRDFKGTKYVEDAVRSLLRRLRFEYRRVENVSHSQALSMYREADIIIDQVLCGSYGMLSVEAMAMGKAVVAYIRDDVKKRQPRDLPIVSATPETLGTVLQDLIINPEKRRQAGIKGRAYAEKHHDIARVTEKLCSIYRGI